MTTVTTTRWPDAPVLPPTTPTEGIRPDRHGFMGLGYKAWVTAHRLETAILRPDAEAGNVKPFLGLVRQAVQELQQGDPDGWVDSDGEPIVSIGTFDLLGEPGGTQVAGGPGMGTMGVTCSLRPSELLALVATDVDARMVGL